MADRPRILVINPNWTEAVTAVIREEVAEVPRPGAVRIDCLTLAEGPSGLDTDRGDNGPASRLQNFKMKITLAGNDTYEAWRESDHDDLVLAAAMAAWYGEKKLWSILTLPPMPRAPIEARQPTLDELIALQPTSGPDGASRI